MYYFTRDSPSNSGHKNANQKSEIERDAADIRVRIWRSYLTAVSDPTDNI